MSAPSLIRLSALCFGLAFSALAQDPLNTAIERSPEELKLAQELEATEFPPVELDCKKTYIHFVFRSQEIPMPAAAPGSPALSDAVTSLGWACQAINHKDSGLARHHWGTAQRTAHRIVYGEPPPPPIIVQPSSALARGGLGGRNDGAAIFDAPFDTVWSAAVESLLTQNIQPKTLDKASGAIIFETDATWGDRWGAVNRTVALMTTKSVATMSTWQNIIVSGNVFCKSDGAARTRVIATFQFRGYNGFAGWLAGWGFGWQPLQSNGWLENAILQGIRERVAATAPQEMAGQASVDDDRRMAEVVLLDFRRVQGMMAAGVEVARVREFLGTAISDLETFKARAAGRVRGSFFSNLDSASSLYKSALDDPDHSVAFVTPAAEAVAKAEAAIR